MSRAEESIVVIASSGVVSSSDRNSESDSDSDSSSDSGSSNTFFVIDIPLLEFFLELA